MELQNRLESWKEFFAGMHKSDLLAEATGKADLVNYMLTDLVFNESKIFNKNTLYSMSTMNKLHRNQRDFWNAIYLLKTFSPYKINCVLEGIKKHNFLENEISINDVSWFCANIQIHKNTIDGKVDSLGENIYNGLQSKLELK